MANSIYGHNLLKLRFCLSFGSERLQKYFCRNIFGRSWLFQELFMVISFMGHNPWSLHFWR